MEGVKFYTERDDSLMIVKALGAAYSLEGLWYVTVTPKDFVSTYGYSKAFSLSQILQI